MSADRELATLSIFDCHGHCGPVDRMRMWDDGSDASMIEVMDRCGIDRIVISSMLALTYDVTVGNRATLDLVRAHPERMYGYVVIHPDDEPEVQIEELERYRDVPGILGVKIHPGMHNSRPRARGYDCVFAWCEESGYPVLSHTWGEADVDDFHTVIGRYPRLKVILGHSGGPIREALERACELASTAESVYVDITCSRTVEGLIEWMLERAPSDRILFGSDTPFLDPRPSIGLVTYADIEDDVRRAILSGNSTRLFAPHLQGL